MPRQYAACAAAAGRTAETGRSTAGPQAQYVDGPVVPREWIAECTDGSRDFRGNFRANPLTLRFVTCLFRGGLVAAAAFSVADFGFRTGARLMCIAAAGPMRAGRGMSVSVMLVRITSRTAGCRRGRRGDMGMIMMYAAPQDGMQQHGRRCQKGCQ